MYLKGVNLNYESKDLNLSDRKKWLILYQQGLGSMRDEVDSKTKKLTSYYRLLQDKVLVLLLSIGLCILHFNSKF
jgi:hypothetical protein